MKSIKKGTSKSNTKAISDDKVGTEANSGTKTNPRKYLDANDCKATEPCMDRRKLRNPFSGFQKRRVAERGAIIDRELAKLSKAKVVFANISSLALHLAQSLGTDDHACSPSTLTRNKEYRAKLVEYLGGNNGRKQMDAGCKSVSTLSMELEIGNLKAETARLKAFISKSGATPPSRDDPDIEHLREQLSATQQKLAQVNGALGAVLENTKGLIELDPSTGNIIDLSRKFNAVIFNMKGISL